MTHLALIANAGDGTISAVRLVVDTDGARLLPLATSGNLPGCGTLAVDPARDQVFAAYKGDPAGIATLRLDRASGQLSEVTRRSVDASLSYLSLTPGGDFLLGASYGGDFGAVWPVAGSTLAAPQSRFSYRNLHCIVAVDDVVYAVSLGDDLIAQFARDGAGLRPLDPPTVPAPVGCGPRHLVVDGANAYLVTEFSGEVIRYVRGTDATLTPAEAVPVVDPRAGLAHSRFGADPVAERLIWGADVHRAGRYLLSSERCTSLISTTSLAADGSLGEVLAFTEVEQQPRGFAVAPDGRHVLAVGERSTDALLLRLEDNGSLTALDRVPIGRGANWVRFVD